MHSLRKLACLLAAGALLSCAFAGQALAGELYVSGAASLTNAFDEVKAAFEKKHPGVKVLTNYAASNPLLRQMQEGAPVDVFATADQQTMDKAQAAGLVKPESRRNFALNDLVLIVPADSTIAFKDVKGLSMGSVRKIAVGNPDSVPAGRYAKASLAKAGLWEELQPKYVMAASVRQALDYVSRGEVDAGFVYRTDALKAGAKVKIVCVVEGHDPVLYPAAVGLTGKNQADGQKFVDFIAGPEGQAILKKFGFSEAR